MPDEALIAQVRSFNRFYTRAIGVLESGLLHTPHTLAEARVLYELGQAETVEVAELRGRMAIDAGQLSRLLARLEAQDLVARQRSSRDSRRQVARLTAAGRDAQRELDRRSGEATGAQLAALAPAEQHRLVGALGEVRRLLDAPARPRAVGLRAPRAGELGWIVERHGARYAEEFGWDASFEALVARIVADFAAGHDPAREAAWIAAADGRPAGCVLCVAGDERTARLRLLLVEPWARGLGLGARLVDACLAFARGAGYAGMTLWTNDPLVAARRIYERAGFTLHHEGEPQDAFGQRMREQTWSRPL